MNGQAGGADDFDFLIGNWRVHHRRLKERLANNHEWIEFEGTSSAQKLLGGSANLDDNVLDFPDGSFRAISLRAFDSLKKQWSIWWLDSRTPGSPRPAGGRPFRKRRGNFLR